MHVHQTMWINPGSFVTPDHWNLWEGGEWRRRPAFSSTGLHFKVQCVEAFFLRMVSKEHTLKWLPMSWEELVRNAVDHPTSCLWDCCRVQSWTLQFLFKELEDISLPRGPTIHTTYLVLSAERYSIVTILLLHVLGQKCHKIDFGINNTFALNLNT